VRFGSIVRAAGACTALAVAGIAAAGIAGPSVRAATRTLTDVTTAVTEPTVTTIADTAPTPDPVPTTPAPAADQPPHGSIDTPARKTLTLSPRAAQRSAAPPKSASQSPTQPQQQAQHAFVFRAKEAGPVDVVVRQLAPTCRVVWTFSMEARAGKNRVDVQAAPGFPPGEYSIVAWRGASTLARERLVIGKRRWAAAPCTPGRRRSEAGRRAATKNQDPTPKPRGVESREPARHAAVLAAHHERAAGSAAASQTALMIILAAATFLLGVAALPRHLIPGGSVGTFVRRRRGPVAAAGIAALAAFLVFYFLT
jgi:hypothetical protein